MAFLQNGPRMHGGPWNRTYPPPSHGHVQRHKIRRGLHQLAAQVQPSAQTSSRQSTLQLLMQNMRDALCINEACNEVSVSGIGRHLGIHIRWRVHWRSDGAFVEEINGKELNFLWGYDGQPSSSCWEVDTSGVSRSLEYDDHEAVLISTWVRTGMWLRPHLTDRLELELAEGPLVADAELGRQPFSTQRQPSKGRSANGALSEQQEGSLTPVGCLSIRVRLKGGKLNNTVHVCTNSWVVQSLQQPLSGDLETWHFGTWRPWTADMRVLYPSDLIHQAVGGGRHVYKVQACSTQPEQLPSAFQLPAMPLLPGDTEYDDSIDSAVPVWRSISGHLLVRPLINGKDSEGYMILDTGASGFVITQSAAISLGLASFGELYAASISGKVQTQFVRAHTWTLGPISIQQPVMMTMTLDGLVRGGPMDGDIIGITGYDLFRRAVVQLPRMCEAGVTQPALIPPRLPISTTNPSGGAAPQASQREPQVLQAPQAFSQAPEGAEAQAPRAEPQEPQAQQAAPHEARVEPHAAQAPQALPQAAAQDPTLLVRSGLDSGSAESATVAAAKQQGVTEVGLSDGEQQSAAQNSSRGGSRGAEDSSSGDNNGSTSRSAQDGGSNSNSRPLSHDEGVSDARRRSNPGDSSSSSSSTSTSSNGSLSSKLSGSSVDTVSGPEISSSSSSSSKGAAALRDAPLKQTQSSQDQASTSSSPQSQPSLSSSIDGQSSSANVRGSSSSSSSSLNLGDSVGSTSTALESKAMSPGSSGAKKEDTNSMNTAIGGDDRSRGKSRGSRRSQTVKVKRRISRSPSPSPSRVGCPQYTMHLYNPGDFSGAAAQGWQWHPFSMISNLPHLEVTFETGAGARSSSLFMLDTGACGSDIMLHARAIQELQMKGLGRSTTQYVRGVGGSNNTRVEMVDLPWIEVAGVRCHKVKCLYAKGISGLDISIYSAGILGGDLLARFDVIIDYARKRLGIRKQW